MKLKAFLIKKRWEPDQFAVEFKKEMKKTLSISSVYRYLREQPMHFRRAKEIEKFTKGEVTLEELLNGSAGPARRAK